MNKHPEIRLSGLFSESEPEPESAPPPPWSFAWLLESDFVVLLSLSSKLLLSSWNDLREPSPLERRAGGSVELPRVTGAPSPGGGPRVPTELANFSVSWRMDGARAGRGVETALFGSAVGRPAVVVAEILETFLDTLALRVAQSCSAPPASVGRATPAASESTDFFCCPDIREPLWLLQTRENPQENVEPGKRAAFKGQPIFLVQEVCSVRNTNRKEKTGKHKWIHTIVLSSV